MPERYEVCPVKELPPGSKTIINIRDGKQSIGVFNIDGEFHALANVCPHQLAPLCEGNVTGEMTSEGPGDFEFVRDGEVIQCPWHGWKFNIKDGSSVFNPHEVKTRTYETTVEDLSEEEAEESEFGTALEGDRPPVENYEVTVEDAIICVYA